MVVRQVHKVETEMKRFMTSLCAQVTSLFVPGSEVDRDTATSGDDRGHSRDVVTARCANVVQIDRR